MTYERLLTRRQRAINFVRNVLHDDDRAEELENESPEDYAARKRLVIANPHETGKESTMAQETRAALQERIEELESENQELQDKLDSIADVVNDSADSSSEDSEDES